MKLFGSFFVIFAVIFAAVLVATGEWDNRVEPALRRVVVQRVLGNDLMEAIDAVSAQVSPDSLVNILQEAVVDTLAAVDGVGGVGGVGGAGGVGGFGGVGGPDGIPRIPSIDKWRVAQGDSLRQMREQVVDMVSRISTLETQLMLLRTARRQGEADAWRSLGKVFASMRAEEASQIIEHLPESQAVQLLSSMNPRNSAELMGKLEPGRAARLSGRLSSYWRDLQTEANLQ